MREVHEELRPFFSRLQFIHTWQTQNTCASFDQAKSNIRNNSPMRTWSFAPNLSYFSVPQAPHWHRQKASRPKIINLCITAVLSQSVWLHLTLNVVVEHMETEWSWSERNSQRCNWPTTCSSTAALLFSFFERWEYYIYSQSRSQRPPPEAKC